MTSLDVCTDPHECPAFACKKTRDQIVLEFEAEIGSYAIKNEKYPELSVMEWVLDRDLSEASKNPPFIGKLVIFLISILESFLKKVS